MYVVNAFSLLVMNGCGAFSVAIVVDLSLWILELVVVVGASCVFQFTFLVWVQRIDFSLDSHEAVHVTFICYGQVNCRL